MLPESFSSPRMLPFNAACLEDDFILQPADADPGGSGVWLLLQRGELWLVGDDLPAAVPAYIDVNKALYLGKWRGQPCRALVVPSALERPPQWRGVALRGDDPPVTLALWSLAALAQRLLNWYRDSAFCPRCGCACAFIPGEWGRQCSSCAHQRYPEVYPCAIVLIKRGDEALLVRKSVWAAGRYGLVAGFVEPGECFEEALQREVREEVGIQVTNIRYIGSQAWPFPAQIMVGFSADYVDGTVQTDNNELEDARWFDRDNLPQLPSKRSIARYLIDGWLARRW